MSSKKTGPSSTLKIAYAVLDAHPSWFLFPIKRGQKFPPLFKDELATNNSNDRAKLKFWHDRWPGCNWGIALKKSKLVVVDCDMKPGKVGEASLQILEFNYGRLPATLTVQTPSGGLHIYFAETDAVKHRMAVSGFGQDVDSTNYILAAGCKLDSGGEYTIITDAPVAPAPDWFAEVLGRNEPRATVGQTPLVELDQPVNIKWAIQYLTRDAPPSIVGKNGESVTLQVAAVLKDHGIATDTIIALMMEHYNVPRDPENPSRPYCEPLWSFFDGPTADRMDVKIRNVRYLKQNAPGSATPEVDFAEQPPSPNETAKLAAWWRQFHLDWTNKHSFTTLHGRRFPVKRNLKPIKTTRRGKAKKS
jgi:hypothetical protein